MKVGLLPAANLFQLLAIGTYITSLILIPFKTRDPQWEMYGISILLLGWGSVLDGHIYAWFANPLAIFCFVRMRKSPVLCVCFGVLALLLAHDFDKVDSLGFDRSQDVRMGRVIALGMGSYFWLGSLALTLLASCLHLVLHMQSRKNQQQSP
jgi:hypothetical protein